MRATVQALKGLVEHLAPEPQEEVQDFVKFLLEKKVMRPKLKPGFDCGGSVRDLRDRYTAGLQHRIAGWRGWRIECS